jgi:Tol biopolymer transport system component
MNMKYTKLLLLIVVFLTSCAAPATPLPEPTQTLVPPTATPTPTRTPVPTATLTPTPTQIGGASGRILFSYRDEEFLGDFPELKGQINLFVANIDGTEVTPVTNGAEDYNYLQDISPDGTKALVASYSKYDEKADLYLVDLQKLNSEPVKLGEGLPYSNWASAANWIDNERVLYIGKGEAGPGMYTVAADGTNPSNVYTNTSGLQEGNPVDILAVDDSQVYWGGDTRRQEGNITWVSSYAWVSSLDGAETRKLEFDGEQIRYSYLGSHNLAFSPDLTKVAWIEDATPESGPPYHNYLHIASTADIDHPDTFEVLSGGVRLAWFPDGTKILAFDRHSVDQPLEYYTEYYTEHPDSSLAESYESLYGIYEVTAAPGLPVKNYALPRELMTWESGPASATIDLYDISPDHRQILVSIYVEAPETDYEQKFGYLNLETYTFYGLKGFRFSNTAVSGVHWIP